MAYNDSALVLIEGTRPGFRLYGYDGGADTLADIAAENYFLEVIGELAVNDMLLIHGSDAHGLVAVNSKTNSVIDVTDALNLSTGGFQILTWTSEWTSTTGDNQGSGNGQQYRGLRSDGARIWASGGVINYVGAATPVSHINSTPLTLTAPGAQGQEVNLIGIGHNSGTGAHEVATIIGNTLSYSRAYAVTHDIVNGYTYIACRGGEHMLTLAGAFQTAHPGDGNVNNLYGAQAGYIVRVITATGVVDKASYFGLASDGDFFRDLVFNPADGYLYGGRARYGVQGTPGVGVQLLKIEPDLSGIVETWDFGNTLSASDGQPSIVVDGTDLWIHFNTTIPVTNGAPLAGAYQQSFGAGSHARSYIARFDLSGPSLAFVQATYLHHAGSTVASPGATHTIDRIAANGGSIIGIIGGGSGATLPTVGTPQFQAAPATGGGAYFFQLSDDLETMQYATYLHSARASERVASSSIRANAAGNRILIPFEVDSPDWPDTDGSSHPEGIGTNRGLVLIMRKPENGIGWEPEFVHYTSYLGALYASEFDADGNAYVAGFDYNANNPIPILERYTPAIYVPPPILTAATIAADGIASDNDASNSIDILVPLEAEAGDYMVFTSVNRNNGGSPATVVHSISAGGEKVGQVATIGNHCMGAFYYQVQPGDPGVNSVTISCNIAFNSFAVSWQLVKGAAAIADTSPPAQEIAFGDICRAGALDTAGTNSLIIFAVSQATANTYSDPSATYTEVNVATSGTAGLAAFSYVEPDVGVAGPFDVEASGNSNSYGWAIAFTGTE